MKRILGNAWVIVFCAISFAAVAQRSAKSSDVYVDKNGIIRWSKNNTEVQGFGVNYTAPFAHGYMMAKKL